MISTFRNAFRNAVNHVGYFLDVNNEVPSSATQEILEKKGWTYSLETRVFGCANGSCATVTGKVVIACDSQGRPVNFLGNEDNWRKYKADKREAASSVWLDHSPKIA